jgi:hypothetical protein
MTHTYSVLLENGKSIEVSAPFPPTTDSDGSLAVRAERGQAVVRLRGQLIPGSVRLDGRTRRPAPGDRVQPERGQAVAQRPG